MIFHVHIHMHRVPLCVCVCVCVCYKCTMLYTEIFSTIQRNGILQTKPSVIHFDGYEVGKVHQQTLVSV